MPFWEYSIFKGLLVGANPLNDFIGMGYFQKAYYGCKSLLSLFWVRYIYYGTYTFKICSRVKRSFEGFLIIGDSHKVCND